MQCGGVEWGRGGRIDVSESRRDKSLEGKEVGMWVSFEMGRGRVG